ncbi:MAG: hypothetical protein COB15_09200 [Flavobacteriales bacterium]|nr:MAG: hypothetical protein COB15_09200 [Flavobacteriales bacterium]
MKDQTDKIWFSFDSDGTYSGNEPAYFDISNYPWYELIRKSTPIFQAEITNRKEDLFVPYSNTTFANKPTKWKFISLISWLKINRNNLKQFPKTNQVLDKIPFLVSAGYSLLDDSSNIKPHIGDSNVMFRIHIPLLIPGGLPNCGFEVLNIKREWKVGEPFAFCDAHQHYAWNNTDERRIILVLDIIRPEFQSEAKWICAKIRTTLALQFLFQKTNILDKLPRFLNSFIMSFGAIFIYPVVFFYRLRK